MCPVAPVAVPPATGAFAFNGLRCYLEVMPFGFSDIFVPAPIMGLLVFWKDDAELKKLFGIELAKEHKNNFEAAVAVFPNEANKALWASTNWINDPIVTEAKQNYIEVTLEPAEKLLDKEEYCRTLLEFSKERIIFNGNEVYANEGKDRLKALELYGKTQGFINDKTEINNNVNSNNKFMEIRFVEPEKKEKVIIEHEETKEENILDLSPIKLKLVG